MTGFGRGTGASDGVRAIVELRSVNQRHLRVSVKIPSRLSVLEPRVRELVVQQGEAGARRGQIEAFVDVKDTAGAGLALPDPGLVKAYVQAWRKMAKTLKLTGDVGVGTLAGMPGFFTVDPESAAAERSWAAVEEATKKALAAFDRMRGAEGKALARDLSTRIASIESSAKRLTEFAGKAKLRLAERLTGRVQALLEEMGSAERVSRATLEREIAVLADRADVSEEFERVRSHIDQFRATLAAGSPTGRKLEFIVQELQREINTLGAKVSDSEAGREVVEFKSELERIREQVQNIE
jgi:uncharacterized protein (TIGR00255 family)